VIARSLKGKIVVFAVFFIGIASGVLITNFYETRVTGTSPALTDNRDRRSRAERDISKVHDYLGLSEEQRRQVNQILEETRDEVRKFRQETQPRFREIQEQSQARIRAILTEDQRVKYDDFRQNLQRRTRDRDAGRERSRPK
jgi:hypothetical protein